MMEPFTVSPATLLATEPPDGVTEELWRAIAPLRHDITARLPTTARADGAPMALFWIPGRIEVMGKHTDYAGGESLLAAAERGFLLAARPRTDGLIRVTDARRNDAVAFLIGPDLTPQSGHWSNYPMTVARRIARNFAGPLQGADIVLASNLPPAAGMSSSSAFMVGVFLVLAAVNRLSEHPAYRREIDGPLRLAEYLGTVENGQSFGALAGDKGVGTFGGSEDHTAILTCKPQTIGRYAFCPTRFIQEAQIPDGYVLAVAVSGVVAAKTGAARDLYNRASALAAGVTTVWNRATGGSAPHMAAVLAQTDYDPAPVRRVLQAWTDDGASAGVDLPSAALLQRFDHFYAENCRLIPAAAAALQEGDMAAFAQAANESQRQGVALLKNQVPATEALAALALEGGAAAASAFGAGFGGSVWALVSADEDQRFLAHWSSHYATQFPRMAGKADFFLTRPGAAASILGHP